jgi:hypothetical protein
MPWHLMDAGQEKCQRSANSVCHHGAIQCDISVRCCKASKLLVIPSINTECWLCTINQLQFSVQQLIKRKRGRYRKTGTQWLHNVFPFVL